MIIRSVKEIAEMINISYDHCFEHVNINGVSIDSRKVMPNQLFIPLKGEQVDGHQYVEQAFEMGASAVLWQKNVPNPPKNKPILMVEDTLIALQELARSYRQQLNVRIIGITGSNGKTTTKDMIANLLGLNYQVQKTEGNYNNHIGMPLTILQLKETTEIAILEMGMSGFGEIDFLTKLAKPNAVVITNIGESHLLDLGSRDGIAKAKLEIIEGLTEKGLIIYNGDEPLLRNKMKEYSGSAKVLTFGKEHNNDHYPIDIKLSERGNNFRTNKSDRSFFLPVLGTHNVLNALAAMLVANEFGISFNKMEEGFEHLKLTNMRMELVKGIHGITIINDAYNASPTSMKAAIELMEQIHGYSKKILVLGDMLELGPLENQFHYTIGEGIDPNKVDYVLTYGILSENIAAGAKKRFADSKVMAFQDKSALISHLESITTGDELILIKASRGMKLEDVVIALKEN